MTSQKTTEQKLRKIISRILKEEGGMETGHGGGVIMDPTGGMSTSGGQLILPGRISGEEFKNVWQSIKDVFSTAAGATKEVLQKVFTFLKVAVAGAVEMIVPLVEAEYDKIFEQEKKNISNIRSKYADATARINAAVGDSDVVTLAFLANPGVFLSGYVLSKTPELAGEILDTITGGAITNSSYSFGSKKKRKNESKHLTEKDDDKEPKLAKAVANKKAIRSAIEKSEKVDSIRKEATEIYRKFLQDVYSEAKNRLDAAESIDGIKQMTGGKFKGLDFSGKDKEKFEKLSKEDKAKVEEELISAIRNSIKELYIKKIKGRISEVMKFGLQKDNQFIVDHEEVIEKINSL